MSAPVRLLPVTILINAFGRTWILAEALSGALRQEYPGEIEILVVNDFGEQVLRPPRDCEQRVRVVNLPQRCSSLGEKRNIGVSLAKHDRIILADDDDIMLPWDAAALMRAHMETGLPTWSRSHFYSEGWPPTWRCSLLGYQTAQHGLIAKAHLRAIGDFKPYSVKDDIDFFHRARATCGGRVLAPTGPGYIYRWATNTHHLAGMSDCASSWERAYQVAMESVRSGKEPKGDVELAHHWKADYVVALRAKGLVK